jgi:hypothetical protein
MAILNIATDVALILFPIPMLWTSSLSFHVYVSLEFCLQVEISKELTILCATNRKMQLTFLFCIGTTVVVITITRLPLILDQSVAQDVRTLVSLACSESPFHGDIFD